MSFLKNLFKNYSFLLIFSVILFFFFLISNVFSWTLPTANPPNNDLPPPLDTSSQEQTKSGNLILENDLTVGGLLRIGLFSSHPTGTNGALYYNSQDHKFYGYQNDSWQELGGGSLWLSSGNNIYYNNGNVGIGTTGPSSKLTVVGDRIAIESNTSVEGGEILLGGPTDYPADDFVIDNYNGRLRFVRTNPSGAEVFTVLQSGNVGIGTTSPGAKLEVAGQIRVTSGWRGLQLINNDQRWDLIVGDSTANRRFAIYDDTNATYRLWIDGTNGNVGIGTTSPSEKLEVSGNIKLSGASPTYRITNVASPVNDSDVATKGYVEAVGSKAIIQITYKSCTYCFGVNCIPPAPNPPPNCPSGFSNRALITVVNFIMNNFRVIPYFLDYTLPCDDNFVYRVSNNDNRVRISRMIRVCVEQ